MEEEFVMVVLCCRWFMQQSTDSFVAGQVFFCDEHGGEAVVGRRDANWTLSNPALTDILLLSTVWVVGAVFVNRNAPALGGILNQQGVSSSTGSTILKA